MTVSVSDINPLLSGYILAQDISWLHDAARVTVQNIIITEFKDRLAVTQKSSQQNPILIIFMYIERELMPTTEAKFLSSRG